MVARQEIGKKLICNQPVGGSIPLASSINLFAPSETLDIKGSWPLFDGDVPHNVTQSTSLSSLHRPPHMFPQLGHTPLQLQLHKLKGTPKALSLYLPTAVPQTLALAVPKA